MTLATALDGATTLAVEAWPDPVVDRFGHDPRSPYCERFWLPVLGPSTIFLLRHLVARLEAAPDGCRISVADTARALGLGDRLGRNGPFARTVARAVDFDMARLSPTTLAVRRRLPPLPRRHLARLPEAARAEHEELARRGADRGEEELVHKARQLALSLARLGEDADATERQLRRWRFEPELARRCASWAAATTAADGRPGAAGSGDRPPALGAAVRPPAGALAHPAAAGVRAVGVPLR
ncbi:MAG: hypothetical protein M0T71_09590 [Actinomycetota bacterium]|nr:hypothetical protein [Actinomycetota bacterium]